MQGRKINAGCEVGDCVRPAISTIPVNCCVVHKGRWQRLGSFELSKWGKPYKTKAGYVRLNNHGNKKFEHVKIMEEHLGRQIKFPDEVVHHKNGIKDDNRIENLELISQSKHMAHHLPGKKLYHSPDVRQIIIDIGNSFTGKRSPKGPCRFPGCAEQSVGRFLCRAHYSRWDFYTNN